MTVFIDADGCPVTAAAVCEAQKYNISCTVIADTAHYFSIEGADVLTVDCSKDSADMKIVSLIKQGDIVVTQDYGLAALVLAKGGKAINQNGLIYSGSNIDSLLYSRYENAKLRNSGNRIKGPGKRKKDADESFLTAFRTLLFSK